MSDCKKCANGSSGQAVYDLLAALAERTIKRLWVIIILLVVLLFGTNAAWVYYESQFVDESWTFEANTDNGGTAIANGDGEVNYYGESKSDQENQNP